MRAFGFVAMLWVLALLFAGVGRSAAYSQPIFIQNASLVFSDVQLRDELPAYQAAISTDFAPYWGIDATLILLPAGADAPAGAWTVTLQDSPDVWGALGYHDVLLGVPYAKVFPTVGYRTQITLTHELFEMLADPYIDRAVRVQRRFYPFYYLETGDPVESDRFAYTRPSATGVPVALSDFVTPAWFRSGSQGPWDFTGHVSRPLQILTGGYQIAWDANRNRWISLCYRNRPCRSHRPLARR